MLFRSDMLFQDIVLYQLVYPELKSVNPNAKKRTIEQKKILYPFILCIFPQRRSNHLRDPQHFTEAYYIYSDTVFTDTKSYNFYTCQGLKINPQLSNMTKQFDMITWLAIMFCFAIVWASTVVTVRCFGYISENHILKLLAPILNTSLGSGIDQTYKEFSLKIYLRIIATSWLFMTLVLNNVYQIIVISDLIEPVPPKIQWNIFRQIPVEMTKHVLLDRTESNLVNQLDIPYHNFLETNMSCVQTRHLNPTHWNIP